MNRDRQGMGMSPDEAEQQQAARAMFLKFTPRKWRLVKLFENLLRAVLPILPSPHCLNNGESLPKSILVVEYWNLGDLAILVPFLQNLRRALPGARISLLVNASLAGFLDGQGLVDEFIPVRVPWAQHFSRWKKYNPFSRLWLSFARTFLDLREKQFDWALSGRMDIRDNLLLWLSGAARRVGYGFAGGGFLLTDQITPDLSRPHRADMWLRLLEALGYPVNRSMERFHLTDAEIHSAREFLVQQGIPPDAPLVGFHPGARIAVRRWGNDRFAEVARRLLEDVKTHILWFSDPGVSEESPRMDHCHSARVDFRTFLALLAQCQLLVCNDSGPMHVANLLNVPVVAVFGPQRPEWFGPRGSQDRVVIRQEFSCRPCFDYCLFDQAHCLRTIAADTVIHAISDARTAASGMSKRGSDSPVHLVQIR